MQRAIQESSTLESQLPEKWIPKYSLKRIGEENITISQQTRNVILKQFQKGGKFVQIGEFTIMLNGIKSIDPYWPPYNIPPRPRAKIEYFNEKPNKPVITTVTNQDEIDEWDKYFKEKSIVERLSD